MDEQIIAIYCICADVLRALRHPDDRQCQMSDAEVLTTAIVAALYFGGNFEKARALLSQRAYVPTMLGKSRFNRRLHRIEWLLLGCFETLAGVWKQLNAESVYIIDSFPIAACDNYRIARNKLYPHDEAYRGYIASKKRYFFGVRIHLLVTEHGQPVEFFLLPGRTADVSALDCYRFDLPEGATIYADGAYNDRVTEAIANEAQRQFLPQRKQNMHDQFPGWVQFFQQYYRKRIETAGSFIEQCLPKSIHAVTAKGFELKVALFVLALSFHCLW